MKVMQQEAENMKVVITTASIAWDFGKMLQMDIESYQEIDNIVYGIFTLRDDPKLEKLLLIKMGNELIKYKDYQTALVYLKAATAYSMPEHNISLISHLLVCYDKLQYYNLFIQTIRMFERFREKWVKSLNKRGQKCQPQLHKTLRQEDGKLYTF
jgi:hypothetical protein